MNGWMIKDDYPKYRRRLLSKTGPGEDCFDLGRTRCGFTMCSQITHPTSTKGLYPLFPKTNSFKTSFIQNHKWTQSKFYPELTLTLPPSYPHLTLTLTPTKIISPSFYPHSTQEYPHLITNLGQMRSICLDKLGGNCWLFEHRWRRWTNG